MSDQSAQQPISRLWWEKVSGNETTSDVTIRWPAHEPANDSRSNHVN